MEPIDGHKCPSELSSPPSSSSCSSSKDHEIKAMELLEEGWFFDNLLMLNNTNKPRNNNMFKRCYSDPCPMPITCQEPPPTTETESSSKTPNEGVGSRQPYKLVRTPSLPPNIGREGHERDEVKLKQKGGNRQEKEIIRSSKSKTIVQPRKNMQTRTQTLPPLMSIEKEAMNQDHHDQQENKGKIMTKSCRRASPNLVDFLPPRHNKGTLRYRSPRRTELVEDINTDGCKEMRRKYFKGRNLRRSLSELESEEVQGFKDLGYTFDNKDLLSPNVVNILPGLQEKKEEDNMGLESKVRRPYLSEAWTVQSWAPPTPNSAATRSSKDMKAHIKFWARSVASNVLHEG